MIALSLPPTLQVTHRQFWEICQANPGAVLELNAKGELEQMSPTGWQGGRRKIKLAAALENWGYRTSKGAAFDSSTGFRLPNGAIRSPDIAWVSSEKMKWVTADEPDSFFPGCPDFVVELASACDQLERLRLKMKEYMDNGASLGWLIVPQNKQVEIYQSNSEVRVMESPRQIKADPVLGGFRVDVTDLL